MEIPVSFKCLSALNLILGTWAHFLVCFWGYNYWEYNFPSSTWMFSYRQGGSWKQFCVIFIAVYQYENGTFVLRCLPHSEWKVYTFKCNDIIKQVQALSPGGNGARRFYFICSIMLHLISWTNVLSNTRRWIETAVVVAICLPLPPLTTYNM